MADLNELLERAAAETTTLTNDVASALGYVGDVLGHATEVADRAGAEGARAREALDALADRLDEIKGEINTEAADARAKLDALQAEARAAVQEITEKGDRIFAAFEKARDDQFENNRELGAASTQLVTELDQATAALDALTAEADEQVQGLERALDDFRRQLDALRQDVESRLAPLSEQAERYADAVEALATRTDEIADDAVSKAREVVDEIRERVPALVAEAADEIGQKYGVEAVRQLDEMLGQLNDELASFHQSADKTLSDYADRRSQLIGHAEQIREHLASIEQVAQAAQSGLSH